MKFATIALGICATFTSIAAAAPANPELDSRIICIGCINTGENTQWCTDKMEPSPDCTVETCTKTCLWASGPGCRCCDLDNGEIVGECYDAN